LEPVGGLTQAFKDAVASLYHDLTEDDTSSESSEDTIVETDVEAAPAPSVLRTPFTSIAARAMCATPAVLPRIEAIMTILPENYSVNSNQTEPRSKNQRTQVADGTISVNMVRLKGSILEEEDEDDAPSYVARNPEPEHVLRSGRRRDSGASSAAGSARLANARFTIKRPARKPRNLDKESNVVMEKAVERVASGNRDTHPSSSDCLADCTI